MAKLMKYALHWPLGDDENHVHGRTIYVQVIVYPNAHVWLWVGDSTGSMDNIHLAVGDKPDVLRKDHATYSTPLIKSKTPNVDAIVSTLSLKLSRRLKGRPVFVSWGLLADNLSSPDKMLELETGLMRVLMESCEGSS